MDSRGKDVGFPPSPRIDYRTIWNRRLRERRNGEDPSRPSTWVLDGLWSAACRQLRAEETERLLAFALDNGSHVVSVAALLQAVESEWVRAHEAFLKRPVRR
jgi:hypothetical protein